jgi:hypothetical protein
MTVLASAFSLRITSCGFGVVVTTSCGRLPRRTPRRSSISV